MFANHQNLCPKWARIQRQRFRCNAIDW